jgi:hypothetical protein
MEVFEELKKACELKKDETGFLNFIFKVKKFINQFVMQLVLIHNLKNFGNF